MMLRARFRDCRIELQACELVPDSHAQLADVRTVEGALLDGLQIGDEASAIREVVDRRHAVAAPQRRRHGVRHAHACGRDDQHQQQMP